MGTRPPFELDATIPAFRRNLTITFENHSASDDTLPNVKLLTQRQTSHTTSNFSPNVKLLIPTSNFPPNVKLLTHRRDLWDLVSKGVGLRGLKELISHL